MRFVVVTGMSGGGKATAINILEDEGFYCVDNLPVRLIDKFMELVFMPGSNVDKVVLGLDVRADRPFVYVEEVLSTLREKGYPYGRRDADQAVQGDAPGSSLRAAGPRGGRDPEGEGDPAAYQVQG